MRRVLTALFISVLCSPAMGLAQDARIGRQGIVVDESGSAVGAARFIVRSANGAVLQHEVTADDGTFTVNPLPAGSYWLEVDASQFRVSRLSLEIDGAHAPPVRVVLGLAPLQSEVTVTAQRGMIAEIDGTPPIVTVRDESDFRRRPVATIGNALEGAAGVMLQQSTYGQASPTLRGLTGYHVLNLIDGVRFNNSTFRSGPNQYLAFADPSQVERVELTLGPASAQFGSDALGGAIQLLTPTAGFRLGSAGVVGVRANVFAASSDRSTSGDATLFLRGRRLSLMAGASARELGDLRAGGDRDSHHVLRRLFGLDDSQIRDIHGGRQIDSGFSQSALHTKMAAQLGRQQNLTVWYQRSAQQDVRGYKDLWGGLGRVQSDFDPQRLQLLYARYEKLGAGKLDWVSGTFSVNSQDDGSVRQGLRATDSIVRDTVRVDAVGYALQAGRHLGARQAIVFGGELYDEFVDARRDQTDPRVGRTEQKRPLYPNGSRYRTTGVFVQDVIDLVRGAGGQSVTAHLGGRFTRVDVRTDAERNISDAGQSFGVVDSELSYDDWTFNAGVAWQPTSVLGFNVLAGRGFRAPNLNDLGALGLNDLGYEVPAASAIDAGAFIGASDGEGALSTGRAVADLKSERLFNFEAGTTVNWRRVHVRVQGFDAEMLDPIVRRTLTFPLGAMPSTLAGTPVTAIVPSAAQLAQGVGSVATALDPRAVKAFVNEGRARYYGLNALVRYRVGSQWSAEGTYSYLVGHDLNPTRPVRRLPPQQGFVAIRYLPGARVSWIEASALFSGERKHLSGGDVTDERIGAARRRSDITDFFNSARISPYRLPGADGVLGTVDDLFAPTGETVAQIRNRVLPIGATINGVTVADDGTRVPLYTATPAFVSVNVRAALKMTQNVDVTIALMNSLDRNYRMHGSGVDAPGRSVFAGVNVTY